MSDLTHTYISKIRTDIKHYNNTWIQDDVLLDIIKHHYENAALVMDVKKLNRTFVNCIFSCIDNHNAPNIHGIFRARKSYNKKKHWYYYLCDSTNTPCENKFDKGFLNQIFYDMKKEGKSNDK